MNLEENWKDLPAQTDDDLSALLKPGKLNTLRSNHPLITIQRNLRYNIGFGVIISLLYIWVFIQFPFWQVYVCIGIVFLFTVLGTYHGYSLLQRLKADPGDLPLLKTLEFQHEMIKRWIRLQERVAVAVYPFAAAGGFMIGGYEGSGKSIEEFMGKGLVQIILVVVIVVLVPLGYWLAKWMNKVAFGNHLNKLKENIEELKS
jgi:uncharacterized membrane protein